MKSESQKLAKKDKRIDVRKNQFNDLNVDQIQSFFFLLIVGNIFAFLLLFAEIFCLIYLRIQ